MLFWSSEIGILGGILAIVLILVSNEWHFFGAGFFLLVGLVCLLAVSALVVMSCCLFVTGSTSARRILFAIIACLSLLLCIWLTFRGIAFLEAAWTFRNSHVG